jgi:hypothetical protein
MDHEQGGILPVRFGPLQGYVCKNLFSPLLGHLLENPDLLFRRSDARIVKQMGNTRTVRFPVEDDEFLLKHYLSRGWGQSVLGLFRGSRGRKAMGRAALFASRHIPTPQPVGLLERRVGFLFPSESYLLFRFHEDLETLYQLNGRLGEDRFLKTGLLEQVGKDVFQMHRAGLCHGDLKWSNILVAENNKGIGLLVDLDGAGTLGFGKEAKTAMDLSRFLVDLYEILKDRKSGTEIFLRGYLKERKESSGKIMKILNLVEKKVSKKLNDHSKVRGHDIRLSPGEITGILVHLI